MKMQDYFCVWSGSQAQKPIILRVNKNILEVRREPGLSQLGGTIRRCLQRAQDLQLTGTTRFPAEFGEGTQGIHGVKWPQDLHILLWDSLCHQLVDVSPRRRHGDDEESFVICTNTGKGKELKLPKKFTNSLLTSQKFQPKARKKSLR